LAITDQASWREIARYTKPRRAAARPAIEKVSAKQEQQLSKLRQFLRNPNKSR
jgi:hypothetical protein